MASKPARLRPSEDPAKLKQDVAAYWNAGPCGIEKGVSEKNTPEYFDEIERARYARDPDVIEFAQFSRFRNKKVLEVGIGPGVDFTQWVRAGAEAYGIDLTEEAIAITRERLRSIGLEARDLRTSDAENIPHPSDFFDLVYSWGVIHHTPDTIAALHELFRVCRVGGECKVMVYNRHSLMVYWLWLRRSLMRGRPFQSLREMIATTVESPGTKAYTEAEIRRILADMPVRDVEISRTLQPHDRPSVGPRVLYRLLRPFVPPRKLGWFMTIRFVKTAPSAD